jgi:hypothetical protein
MGAERWCRRAGVGLLWLLSLSLPAVPVLAQETLPANLVSTTWRLQTALGEAEGGMLLLRGPDHRWRLEVAIAPSGRTPLPVERTRLAQRQGEGWTLTLEPDSGFLQPWHEPWRSLSPQAIRAIDDLLERWLDCVGDTGPVVGPRRWRQPVQARSESLPVPDLERLVLDPADLPDAVRPPGPAGGLRARLVARGLGRGAVGLGLKARWTAEDLQMHSSRWPGGLSIRLTGNQAVAVPAEAFLPLWPLADFLP